MAETFDRAAVSKRWLGRGNDDVEIANDIEASDLGADFVADFRATLAALDAATARVRELEAQVRRDHVGVDLAVHGSEGLHCFACEPDGEMPAAWPCAVLTTLALAPAPGEENG